MHPAPGFSAFVLTSLFLVLSACAVTASTAPVIALPNGYYLQRNKGSDIALVKRSGRTLVRGPIAAYAVHRDIVAGCVGEWPPRAFSYPNETPFPEHAEAEYFVLETKSGQLASDLTLAEWKQHLKALGVPESFRIVAPLLPTWSSRAEAEAIAPFEQLPRVDTPSRSGVGASWKGSAAQSREAQPPPALVGNA